MKSEQDAFLGAFLGCAIGDAVGEIAQKKDLESQQLRDAIRTYPLLEYTDDTAMSISVAEALINDGRIEPEFLGQRFHSSWILEPSRGYSDDPPCIFFAVEKQNLSYMEASKHVNKALYGDDGSDDGAAMRVHPIGLFFDTRKKVVRNAGLSARVTHRNQVAIDGAKVIARAVSLCRRAGRISDNRFLQKLAFVCRTRELKIAIRRLPSYLEPGRDPKEVCREYGNTTRSSTRADSVVPFAIYCFLANKESFGDCLAAASCSGGDADTIAAMACAISGSFLGRHGLPDDLVGRVENREYLSHLANGLYKRKHGNLRAEGYSEWRATLPENMDTTIEEL